MVVNEREEKAPVVEEYAGLAPVYDQRWAFYIEATTEATIAALPRLADEEILDVGCGTGVLLEKLLRKYPEVSLTGIDPVQEMLTVAGQRVGDNAQLMQGWAEGLPVEDNSFDVVVSCNMFHYIQGPRAALEETRRVLRPQGTLVITDWCDDFLACRLCGWWLQVFSTTPVTVYRQRECLELLKDAGFPEPTIKAFKINWLWGLMTVTATN